MLSRIANSFNDFNGNTGQPLTPSGASLGTPRIHRDYEGTMGVPDKKGLGFRIRQGFSEKKCTKPEILNPKP